MANRNATSNQYQIPVEISYVSSNSKQSYSSVQELPIKAAGSSIFQVESVQGNLSASATYTPLTFQVKNTGNIAAQSVTLSLQAIYPITTVGSDAYVSSILPGGTANVTFYVSIDSKGKSGNYPVTLYEQWRQPNGATQQQYSGSNGYYATVGSGAQSKGSTSNYIIAVVAIVIVAVVAYRFRGRFMKKKEPSKKK